MTDPVRGKTVAVDRIVCVGRGLCAGVLPERITLDEWGYPILDHTPVEPAAAREAVRICPVGALYLRSEDAGSGAGSATANTVSSGR